RPGGRCAGNHVVVGVEAQPAIVVTGQDEGYGRLFGGRPPVEVVEDARVVEQRAPAPVARLGGVRRFIEVVGGDGVEEVDAPALGDAGGAPAVLPRHVPEDLVADHV